MQFVKITSVHKQFTMANMGHKASKTPLTDTSDGEEQCDGVCDDGRRSGKAKTKPPPPHTPSMKYVSARLDTFKSWPKQMRQKKHEMASAGWIYTGQGDKVRCFHCNCGVYNWEYRDNPWKEHHKWQKNCEFLKLCYAVEEDDYDIV